MGGNIGHTRLDNLLLTLKDPIKFLEYQLMLKWLQLGAVGKDGWAKVVSGNHEIQALFGVAVTECNTIHFWKKRVLIGTEIKEIDDLDLWCMLQDKCNENEISSSALATYLCCKYFA